MKTKNRYIIRSRISEAKFREIVKLFLLDLQANQISQISGISRNSINKYLKAIRLAIIQNNPMPSNIFQEYSHNSNPNLIGIINHHGKIYTQLIPKSKEEEILYQIKHRLDKIDENSQYTQIYNGVIHLKKNRYYRLEKSEHINTKYPITTSEAFWRYSKNRLSKFRGLSKNSIYLHFKECEFRFNTKDEDQYPLLLKLFREKPLKLSNTNT